VVGVRHALSHAVAWHDTECGAYSADLPLWRELARSRPGRVLDLGAGTGRVSLELALAGHAVTAIDLDPELCEELEARAAGTEGHVQVADARDVRLRRAFGLVLAPMQLVQLMGGPEGRARLLATIRVHLAPGGLAALALAMTGDPLPHDAPVPLPDVRELEGWVFSSTPLAVREVAGGLEIVRQRQVVGPDGSLGESEDVVLLDECTPEQLEREARALGLLPAGRRSIAETADHVGSTVVLLEAAG
jgi:SAM-dependent methyltransferase